MRFREWRSGLIFKARARRRWSDCDAQHAICDTAQYDVRMKPNTRERVESTKLRVGFLLTPRFTLTAFAGFVDALRLAADEGDRSRPLLAQWAVLDAADGPVLSSCGASVAPNAPLE